MNTLHVTRLKEETPNTKHQTLLKAPPRLMIAAPQGRSGKTTVAIAVARALRNLGLAVQPFKKGPDYIDPSWLRVACGRDCSNLDSFLMPEDVLLASFARRSRGADVVLVEGAMGLFDSPEPDGKGSGAALARMLGIPVILVVNTTRMTRSVGAMVSGYQHFEPGTPIAGVILNQVSGKRHREKLVSAVEGHCGIPVLGAVPRDAELRITERHLGLIPAAESGAAESVVEQICNRVVAHLDLDGILKAAREAPESLLSAGAPAKSKASVCRIGVLADRVFSFYYPENLEALREAGADVRFIDSLAEPELPDIDGLFIGGGFPEFYPAELEANEGLRRNIARRVEEGMPLYAECAGLMYLCRAIHWQGRCYEMVGVIPADVELSGRPQGHGYVEAEVMTENPWFPTGLVLRGHEFHHSRLIAAGPLTTAYSLRRGHGLDGRVDGVFYKNFFASYTHLHALGVPGWASTFVALAKKYKGRVKVELEEMPSEKQEAKRDSALLRNGSRRLCADLTQP